MGAPPPPPGWYPDPNGGPRMRYFDGVKWAEQISPLNASSSPFAPGPMQPPYKSAAVAGVLQLFFGTFGIGRFYIGTTGMATAQLVLGLVGLFFTLFCFVGVVILVPLWIWTFVDAIMMFAGAVTDGDGRKLQ
ncbi:TM2 domain-containing membrane protein YozV [Mycolicibacterium sp. BK556]|uniref:TM2 domain-containing protein n=1 Tax=Mycobacteriaceae TaxID=1762 RepID=UPI001060588E|nr:MULTISPECIES: TM2 domain-containing protein [Mycobacteriaceae]MBB3601481.1 TM2 domain-containing membrane protein YozV [Mycolicibacterium sp. BK556]MBB3631233.1 TM2 domain-containing membrane protein YozV [Mycolicibacterium sp. BK607]MBB3749237.1 TM2 domain-containing membrane protein YozV [Mycolicibacterium sp. BK634]TDO14544.1 TM2 domain-containing membrane protein YozV [Mycobacterium sp. BK086]